MSLRNKILIAFLVPFLSALGILASSQYLVSGQALKRAIGGKLQARVELLFSLVDAHLSNVEQQTRSWTHRDEIPPNIIVDDVDGILRLSLRQLHATGNYRGPLDCADVRGTVIASSDPKRIKASLAGEPYFPGVVDGRDFLGDLEPLEGGAHFGIRVALPIVMQPDRQNQGRQRVVGLVCGYMDWEPVLASLREFERQALEEDRMTVRYLLADGTGLVQASRVSDEILREDLSGALGLTRRLARLPRKGSLILGERGGVEDLVTFCASERKTCDYLSNKIAISAVTVQEALAPARTLLELSVWLGLIIAVIMGLFGAFSLDRQVRPIRDYVKFAGKVGCGDLSGELTVNGTDDLAFLGESLNRMQKSLLERSRELERQAEELRWTNRKLESKSEALAQSSRYKSEFLANMSHELRTPLNGILILSKLLAQNRDGNLTPKQVSLLTTISTAGTDLLRLISDVLDLSKIEAGRMTPLWERTKLATVTEDLRQVFEPLAASKGGQVRFSLEVAPDVPDEVVTDRPRLEQVLRNLLSNAVKFTDSGSVTLVVSTTELELAPAALRAGWVPEHGRIVTFRVTDTGIGIPPDKLELIFEAFQQADGTISRRFGGTGLGLSISTRLAQLLGARIEVSSEPGRGTCFTVHAPQFPAASIGASREPQPRPPDGPGTDLDVVGTLSATVLAQEAGTLRGKSVLVVDDDMRNVLALTCALEVYQIRILTAENGMRALEALEKDPGVDLILMDVMMPVMDGLEATRRIRADGRLHQVPIIALTAKALQGDRERCLEAGASDYLTKPIHVDVLVSTMLRWFTTDVLRKDTTA